MASAIKIKVTLSGEAAWKDAKPFSEKSNKRPAFSDCWRRLENSLRQICGNDECVMMGKTGGKKHSIYAEIIVSGTTKNPSRWKAWWR